MKKLSISHDRIDRGDSPVGGAMTGAAEVEAAKTVKRRSKEAQSCFIERVLAAVGKCIIVAAGENSP